MPDKQQGLLNLIQKAHKLVENTDLEKHRQSQDQFAALLSTRKDMIYEDILIDDIHAEWIRVNRPHDKKKVILYCHGGGYSTGSSTYARAVTTKLASATSLDVLCFDYRLAPEYPYPAQLEDAEKAWDYLMLLGYGAEDVILAGDSAGGNLALVLTYLLRENKRMLPKALLLFSPWTDLTSSGKSHQNKEGVDPVLNAQYLEGMIENYLAQKFMQIDLELLQNPLVSPLFADFTGFPPTYIQVGDEEVLLSDAELLAKKMTKAKVSVKLDVFHGMWHVFQMSPLKKSGEAIDKCAEFIFDL